MTPYNHYFFIVDVLNTHTHTHVLCPKKRIYDSCTQTFMPPCHHETMLACFFAEAKVAEDELEGYEQFVLSLLSGSDAWPWKTMILNGV